VATLADDTRMRTYEVHGERMRAVEVLERRLFVD
jgi:hypothetical protein